MSRGSLRPACFPLRPASVPIRNHPYLSVLNHTISAMIAGVGVFLLQGRLIRAGGVNAGGEKRADLRKTSGCLGEGRHFWLPSPNPFLASRFVRRLARGQFVVERPALAAAKRRRRSRPVARPPVAERPRPSRPFFAASRQNSLPSGLRGHDSGLGGGRVRANALLTTAWRPARIVRLFFVERW